MNFRIFALATLVAAVAATPLATPVDHGLEAKCGHNCPLCPGKCCDNPLNCGRNVRRTRIPDHTLQPRANTYLWTGFRLLR